MTEDTSAAAPETTEEIEMVVGGMVQGSEDIEMTVSDETATLSLQLPPLEERVV